jgi:hypothetical protein
MRRLPWITLLLSRYFKNTIDLPARIQNHSGSGSQACVKLPGGLQEFTVLPDWQHAAEPFTQGPDIFHDDGTRLDFHDPLGGKIAKDIFDIPRVTHTTGEDPPSFIHLG